MTPCRDAEQMPPPLNLTNIEYSKYEIGCSRIQHKSRRSEAPAANRRRGLTVEI